MVLFSKGIIYNLIFKQNMSRRLPVYILIDTSGSMKGEPIESMKWMTLWKIIRKPSLSGHWQERSYLLKPTAPTINII